jgi:flagellar hook assembly protein FlgD
VLPNPFRDRVEIGFSLPTAGLVRVEVFDVQGRCVRTEPEVYLPAGNERVTWDGRGNDGTREPRGSYSIRVAGRGFEIHRRVVLLD